ncbi:MAG: hypothetical protein RPR97_17515, partial [Colwellia sp.]
MTKPYFILALFLTFMLFGCNGHNEGNSVNSSQVVANIELSLLDNEGNAKQSFSKNETITLQA